MCIAFLCVYDIDILQNAHICIVLLCVLAPVVFADDSSDVNWTARLCQQQQHGIKHKVIMLEIFIVSISISISRLPCSVFCICQLTEQEVVTPYTRRNFVNGTSTARKGLFDWFFLQKRHLIYMSPAQKQLTGRKMVKNPPKKVFFFQTLQPAGWVCP